MTKERFDEIVCRLECPEITWQERIALEFEMAEILAQPAPREQDTLTVKQLRPMSEAPKNGTEFLAFGRFGRVFIASWDPNAKRWSIGPGIDNGMTTMKDHYFKGWIPLPVYKPDDENTTM